MLNRNPYLSNKAFSFYLLASILATISTTMGVVIDALIVGQILGVKGLSAINLSGPLLQFVLTLVLLINSGNALMMAFSIGNGREKDASEYFTFAIILNIAIGIVFVFAGIFFSNQICAILCPDPELLPLVHEYVRVVLLTAPVYFILPGISFFIRADGAPKLTTIALLSANVINLFLDIIFIKYFDWGIAGSSWATSCGYFIGILILLTYFLRKKSSISLVRLTKAINIPRTLLLGVPVAMAAGLMTVRLISVNHIVLDYLGSLGISFMAVCISLIMLVSMFVSGTIQALQPVGALMIGQNDYNGLKFVVKKAFKTLFVVVALSVILFELVPEFILGLFGFENRAEYPSAMRAIRIVVLSFLPFAITYLLMVIYQLTQRSKLAIFISVAQPLVVVPIMFFMGKVNVDSIWWAFVIGELTVMAIVCLLTMLIRKKDKSLSAITLLPPNRTEKTIELSIETTNRSNFAECLETIDSFLSTNNIDTKVKNCVELCCEELIANILQYGYTDKGKHYIDISILIMDEQINISIKDDGKVFNPINYESSTGIGLLIVKGVCKELKYKYLYGQNMVFATVQV